MTDAARLVAQAKDVADKASRSRQEQLHRLRHDQADGPNRHVAKFETSPKFEAMIAMRAADPHGYRQLGVPLRLALGFYESAKEHAQPPAPDAPADLGGVASLDDAYARAEKDGVSGFSDPLFRRAAELRRQQVEGAS